MKTKIQHKKKEINTQANLWITINITTLYAHAKYFSTMFLIEWIIDHVIHRLATFQNG